jgi:glycosyltransferase involved in cell wall biosynthesis
MPCYKNQHTIVPVLDSALNQTDPFDEIICYVDASPDNTVGIIKTYRLQHRELPLRIIIGEEHSGQAYACNRLAEAALSPYIHFHDADDRLHPQYVKRVRSKLQFNTVVVTYVKIFELDGTEPVYSFDGKKAEADPMAFAISDFVYMNAVSLCKTTWRNAGGWNEELTFYNDHDFFARCIFTGARLIAIEDVLAVWERRPDSTLENLWRERSIRHNADLLNMSKDLAKYLSTRERRYRWQFAELVLEKMYGAYKLAHVSDNAKEIVDTLDIDYTSPERE